MKHEQKNALIEACRTDDEVRIITCALHIAATAARERRQDTAMVIRHLVDAHQGREQAEKEYKRQRLNMATQILAGLAANPGGPYQENPRSGWGLCNCDHSQAAGEAIALADSLMVANAVAPLKARKVKLGVITSPSFYGDIECCAFHRGVMACADAIRAAGVEVEP